MNETVTDDDTAADAKTREEPSEAKSPTGRIGRVVSVAGAQVICLLDQSQGVCRQGESLQIGSLVKLAAHKNTVFGMVSGLSIPIPSRDGSNDLEIVEVELIGEMPDGHGEAIGTFRRGVSVSPGLDDHVFAATKMELMKVYERRSENAVEIGTLQQSPGVPAYAVVDDLLGKHFSIVGTTGSGKSCAVALILHSIIEKHPNSHIVLLDPTPNMRMRSTISRNRSKPTNFSCRTGCSPSRSSPRSCSATNPASWWPRRQSSAT